MDKKKLNWEIEKAILDLKNLPLNKYFDHLMTFAIEFSPDDVIYIFYRDDEDEKSFKIFTDSKQLTKFHKYMMVPSRPNRLKMTEHYFTQDYINIIIENNDPDELDEEIGPVQKFIPLKIPEKIEDKNELELILKVLRKLKDIVQSTLENSKGLYKQMALVNGRGLIPFIRPLNRNYQVDRKAINHPEVFNEEFVNLEFNDEILLSKLKQMRVMGEFAVEFFYNSVPEIFEELGPDPTFINGLIMFDYLSGAMEPIHIPFRFEDNPDEFLHYFAEEMFTFRAIPEIVHIRDQKTLSIVRDFFNKLGVEISEEEDIPELDLVEDEMFEMDHTQTRVTPEEIDDIEGVLNLLDDPDFFLPMAERVRSNINKISELTGREDTLNLIRDIIEEKPIFPEDLEEKKFKIADGTKSLVLEATVFGYGSFRVETPIDEVESVILNPLLQFCNDIKELPDLDKAIQFIDSTCDIKLTDINWNVGEIFDYNSNELKLNIILDLIKESTKELNEISIIKL